MVTKQRRRPQAAINTRISELGGFLPLSATTQKNILLPLWMPWTCYACGRKSTVMAQLPVLLRNSGVSLGEFTKGLKAAGVPVTHFSCEECFEQYKKKFREELVAARLAGEI